MFNELRSDLVLLYELKQAFANCEYELQMLRHRYEALAKAGSLGPGSAEGTHADGPAAPGAEEGKADAKDQIIDVVGAPLTPNSVSRDRGRDLAWLQGGSRGRSSQGGRSARGQ